MNKSVNRREFSRFPIDFLLVVTGSDRNGLEFRDEAVLVNISGGGASFTSLKEYQYFQDQALNISIDMPGSAEVEAQMQATARVVRINLENDPDVSSKIQVSIEFNEPLHFDRLSVEPK